MKVAVLDSFHSPPTRHLSFLGAAGTKASFRNGNDHWTIPAAALSRRPLGQGEGGSRAEEAVSLAGARPFDLLVLDMIMDPGTDGLDTYLVETIGLAVRRELDRKG
jgi:hypothetical protein